MFYPAICLLENVSRGKAKILKTDAENMGCQGLSMCSRFLAWTPTGQSVGRNWLPCACPVQSTLGSCFPGWAQQLRPCERAWPNSSPPHVALCWLYPILWQKKKLGAPRCKNSFCNWSSSQRSLLWVALGERPGSPGSSQQWRVAHGAIFLLSFFFFRERVSDPGWLPSQLVFLLDPS